MVVVWITFTRTQVINDAAEPETETVTIPRMKMTLIYFIQNRMPHQTESLVGAHSHPGLDTFPCGWMWYPRQKPKENSLLFDLTNTSLWANTNIEKAAQFADVSGLFSPPI